MDVLTKRVKTGDAFQGKLKVDRNDINDAVVFVPKYDIEIKIQGA